MSSHSSKKGSQSTLYGSVKSSKSSASFFGSCRSTDTIGSFHTAYSTTSNQSVAGQSGATSFFGSCRSTDTIGSFHTAYSTTSNQSQSGATSFFGSCRSTDTIGSFHTARSISLSTLYFSAKNYGWGDDEDSKTLNWTMNIDQSFDELSDTSTLVGDYEDDKLDNVKNVVVEDKIEELSES